MKKTRKQIIICTLLTMSVNAFASKSFPFQDKLEFGMELIQVLGGTIAIISLLAGLYTHKQGRSDSLAMCVWIFCVGILTANIDWFAEKIGLLQGVLF